MGRIRPQYNPMVPLCAAATISTLIFAFSADQAAANPPCIPAESIAPFCPVSERLHLSARLPNDVAMMDANSDGLADVITLHGNSGTSSLVPGFIQVHLNTLSADFFTPLASTN